MLGFINDDALGRILAALQLEEAVRLGALDASLKTAVRSIRRLYIPRGGARKVTLQAILAFNHLEELCVDGFQVDDMSMRELLRGLPQLCRLSIIQADVSGLEIFQEDGVAPLLEHLALKDSSRLYRDTSPALHAWPTLVSLDVSRSLLTDMQFDAMLLNLAGLQTFIARACKNLQVCGLSIDLAAAVPSLKVVDLSGTSIVDRAVKHLSNVPSLFQLRLENCRRLQSPTITNANLSKLSLSRCRSLVHPFVKTPCLEELVLSHTNVEDDVVESILSGCWSSLQWLDLSECTELRLPLYRPPLHIPIKRVHISKTSVSTAFLEAIIENAAELQCIEAQAVSSEFKVAPASPCAIQRAVLDQACATDYSLQVFVTACPALEFLSLRFAAEVSRPPQSLKLLFLDLSASALDDAGLCILHEACPALRVLLARACEGLRHARLPALNLRHACLCLCARLENLEVEAPQLGTLDLGSCLCLGALNVVACPKLKEVNLFISAEGLPYDQPSAGRHGQMSRQYETRRAALSCIREHLQEQGVIVSTQASGNHNLKLGMAE